MTTTTVTEAAGTVAPTRAGVMRVQIISEGVGSSGTYPGATLEQAAEAGVFPAGLHVHFDHPTATESVERPERSVLTLAGTLTTDAEWNPQTRALEADFSPYPSVRDAIVERAEDIGLSIRASAEVTEDGTIARIVEAQSVDLVTHAGRGGRILEVIESARREIAERNGLDYTPRHAAQVSEATNKDIRRVIADAVDSVHDGDGVHAHLDDFDDTHVYFTLHHWDTNPTHRGTYRQRYALDGLAVTLTGEPERVERETSYSPSPEPDNPIQESTAPAGGTMVDINESELSKLRESAERYETEKARADQAEQALTEALAERTRAQAETIVAEAFEGIDAPKAKARLIEAATTGNTFDPEAFKAEAQESAAEFTPAGPQVTGFGNTTPTPASEAETVSDDDIVKILKEAR